MPSDANRSGTAASNFWNATRRIGLQCAAAGVRPAVSNVRFRRIFPDSYRNFTLSLRRGFAYLS